MREKLLKAAEKAAAYVGQKRYWTPNYPNAKPIECTAWSCSVSASFNCEGMTTNVGEVWTNYRTTHGRMNQVWFPAEQWEKMPEVSAPPMGGGKGGKQE